jgi:hypothetical protein
VDGAGVPVVVSTGDDGGIVWFQHASDAQTAKQNHLSNSSLGIQYVLASEQVQKAGYRSRISTLAFQTWSLASKWGGCGLTASDSRTMDASCPRVECTFAGL